MNTNAKQFLLNNILPVVIGYVMIILFFSPIYKGKKLAADDIQHGIGVSHQVQELEKKNGEKAYWNPFTFGGTPSFVMNEEYSDKALKSPIYSTLIIGLKSPSDIIFLCFLFTFICLRTFNSNSITSFMGAFAFSFCLFNMIGVEVGHNAKIRAIAFLPLLISGVHLIFNNKKILGASIVTLALTYLFYIGHVQITYYALIITGVIGLTEAIYAVKEKAVKLLIPQIGLLILAVALSLGANFSKLYATYEYKDYSIRGKQLIKDLQASDENQVADGLDKSYAFRWSNGLCEPLTLMIPHFYGGGSSANYDTEDAASIQGFVQLLQQQYPQAQPYQLYPHAAQQYNRAMYWGDQPFTAGPYYAGAVICFLFVLGLVLNPGKRSWWLLGSFWFFLILSFGDNLSSINYFLFDYLPFYNKFRTVTMTMGVVTFVLVLGAVLGLNDLITKKYETEALKKKLYIAFGLTGGLTFLLLLLSFFGIMTFMKSPVPNTDGALINEVQQYGATLFNQIVYDRQSLFNADCLLTLLYIGLAFGLIWLYIKGSLKAQYLAIGICLITVVDIWVVNKVYFGDDKFKEASVSQNQFKFTSADKRILDDNKNYARTFNTKQNPTNDSKTSYYHYSIGGYHPAKLRRTQDIFDRHFSKGSQSVFDMLNIKYFKMGDKAEEVQINPGANGNAWFVKTIKSVNGAEAEINAIAQFDSKNVAIIDEKLVSTSAKTYNNNGTIKVTKYGPNDYIYNVSTTGNSFVVFSEVYYPEGWEVTIDDKPVDMKRVNYLLRGLEVPKGNHLVAFKFRPYSYTTGNTITYILSLLVLLGAFGAIGFEGYQYYKKSVK